MEERHTETGLINDQVSDPKQQRGIPMTALRRNRVREHPKKQKKPRMEVTNQIKSNRHRALFPVQKANHLERRKTKPIG